MKNFLKALFVMLVLAGFTNNAIAKEIDKQPEQDKTIAQNIEKINLIEKSTSYNQKLDELKMIFVQNVTAIANMTLNKYDLYNTVEEYEQHSNNEKAQMNDANWLCYKISNDLYWYDSNTGKKQYISFSKEATPELQKVIFNLATLSAQNQNLFEDIKTEMLNLKSQPDFKKNYTKEELKNFRKTFKRAQNDFKKADRLKVALTDTAKFNNIELIPNNNKTEFKKLSNEFAHYPSITIIENSILSNPGSITFKTDTAEYYNQINKLRAKALPVLSSLLVTADINKQLELKRKNLEAQKNKLSKEELNAQMSKLMAEEDAAILSAVEAQDINKKIANFTEEQKAQYRYVRELLMQITSIQVNRLIKNVNDTYNTYKAISNDPLSGLAAAAEKLPTKEENIYISIVRKRATTSSESIQDKLNKLDNINNVEKNAEKAVVEKKQKKAKKIKEEDMDFE